MEWSYVFVSHSADDFELVEKLAKAMRRIGIRPFLSEYYMSAGNEISKKIKDAIQDCNCFVPILSKNSIRSQWVNQEIGYVYGTREHGHEIYPIPIVEKGLEINGFINKSTEYIELDYDNLEYATYLLLKRL